MNRHQGVAHVVALVVMDVCLLAPSTFAQDCPELVGHWAPRSIRAGVLAVAVSGDYAYVAGDRGLSVIDVSAPSTPVEVGFVAAPGPGQASDVAVSGGYAYVAWDNSESLEGGLRVIDVSAPTAPVEVGFVATPREAVAVAVSGGYAYVAAWDSGLRVIDVSAPTAPVEVGFLATPREAVAVAVSGTYAYVAALEYGFRVIDVSNPTAPVEVASIDPPDYANDVVVSGSYAYVAWDDPDSPEGRLSVIDVSEPSAPVEVSFVNTYGYPHGVAVSGGYAYLASTSLSVIDVSNPTAPVEVGWVDFLWASDVAVSGSYAYVVAGLLAPYSLRVIDVSTPSAPVEVGSVVTLTNTRDVAVTGGYAYVADEFELRVIDVSTPSAPAEVGSVETSAADVAVSGGYAYVAAGDAGLLVIDVSTPSSPMGVAFLDTPYEADSVAVAGGHAYVTSHVSEYPPWGSLQVVDVSTPWAPVEVGVLDTQYETHGIAVAGGYAYVAWSGDLSGGLSVIDVSTPSAPMEVGSVNTPGWASGVAVDGGYAYVTYLIPSTGGGGLVVIDVSTPSEPVAVGSLDAGAQLRGIAVSGGYAYASEGWVGLGVIDVSTPSEPIHVAGFATQSFCQGVAVSGGYVYLTAGQAGLYVFSECTSPDAYESFIPAAAVAAGAQGAFFQTDVEISNTGTEEAEVSFQWLPRGEDNSEPMESELFTLAPGASLRFENVLTEVFDLEPDSLGALKMAASTESVIGMSRTYNIPAGKVAGTFGQGLPAIRATEMIAGPYGQRIIFLSEDPDSRANVGCVNGSSEPVRINIWVFDDAGSLLETKTMDLGPYSNNQINRVFRDYQPVNGYVLVAAFSDGALYYCYGSMLDNLTSDPTTILPQVASADTTFISAAALAAGLEGAFFQTDVDLNNAGSAAITYELWWLPRGADNSEPTRSELFSLAPGAGVRYANVLGEVFGLEPDQAGGLAIEASEAGLLAMSRTYNLPSAKVAGTFGQEMPGIPGDRMIQTGVKKRIIFMNENDDVRSNVGCQNAGLEPVTVTIELHSSDGERLGTRTMELPPLSNDQITRVFRNYAPITAGYVDVWTDTEGASIYCYGSVLDNLTSDPTTVLPQ